MPASALSTSKPLKAGGGRAEKTVAARFANGETAGVVGAGLSGIALLHAALVLAAAAEETAARSVIAGIDQGDDLLGAQAVELLIAQLHHNERGPPRHPGIMLFMGRWMGATAAAGIRRPTVRTAVLEGA